MCIVVWPLMTLPPSALSPLSLSLISALFLPWTTVRLPLSVIQITKKNEYIYEAHCMHHYTHTVIHTYKWSNDRPIRIKLNTAGFETGIQGLNGQQLRYSWRIFRGIQSWTRQPITLRGTCRVDRKSRFVHFFWRLSLVETLISASHDGIILLILSHRDKNRDLISVLLNWLLVLNVDLISDLSYWQLESFLFEHVIH